MPRKSPRARRRPGPQPRLPGKSRPRAAPGRKRTSARRGPGTKAKRHALQGARTGRAQVRRPGARSITRAKRAKRFQPPDPARVAAILEILERTYPEARTALDFRSPLQLLIATILSAQCTDARVNQVTPALFERFPDAASLAGADRAELEGMIRSTGFFRNKARAIQAASADIVGRHGGEVPRTLEELVALHGVGRKTANVVLGNAYGIPGVVVDTHVGRLAKRLGLTRETDPVRVEFALMPILPRERWTLFSHWLILHGRRVCVARKPRCSICPLAPHCPRIGVTTSQ
jgi:endonuclease-3